MMTDESKAQEHQAAKLPNLEMVCPRCDGDGRSIECADDECALCDGAGFIPTLFGRQILNLMRHNSRSLVKMAESGE